LTIFENCGHFCYQDKDQEFTQLVQNWITGGYRLGDTHG
jgi:pimeloyl-ACP methyl ester carboxylesterase